MSDSGTPRKPDHAHVWGPRTGPGRAHVLVADAFPEDAPVCVRCGVERPAALPAEVGENDDRLTATEEWAAGEAANDWGGS